VASAEDHKVAKGKKKRKKEESESLISTEAEWKCIVGGVHRLYFERKATVESVPLM
jgi:hypothetical protein